MFSPLVTENTSLWKAKFSDLCSVLKPISNRGDEFSAHSTTKFIQWIYKEISAKGLCPCQMTPLYTHLSYTGISSCNLSITIIMTSSHLPLIFKVAWLSFGVHCRFTMYNLGLQALLLLVPHRNGYLLKTWKMKKLFYHIAVHSISFEPHKV